MESLSLLEDKETSHVSPGLATAFCLGKVVEGSRLGIF